MSFNGSGTFLINSTGQPVVANTVISATVFNALTADLASGLTNCITKDGQSTPTANIPMGSNKITGLANGTLTSDAATLGQVQTTAAKLIGSISGVDTITGVMSPTLPAYAAGQLFYFVAGGANTGAVTLNIDSLGAKAVTRDGSTALAAGDINSGEMVVVIYDGTRFQMINAANSFGNTTINGTLTVTGNTGLQANVSITSTLSVGGTFAVTGAATLGSTLAVTGKSDLPTVSTASINAAVAVVTTGTVTNLTSTSASIASVNAGVALLTTATVTNLTASGASIASANIGNLQFTAASIASINAGVAVVTNLTATSASIASANVGTAVVTTGTVTNLTSTSASIASANAAVALVTTGTVTNLTSTAASIASANLGTAVVTTGTVTNLTATSASIASANAGAAVVTNLTATGASIASANVGTGVVTALTVTGASIASANVGTGVITTLTATGASVASINAGVALVTTGTVTNLTSTAASIASANVGTAVLTGLTVTNASIASLNAGTATITSGNLTFSGTGQRITGDFSNATVANRLMFQGSVTNATTFVGLIPNGTGTTSSINCFGTSDPTNAPFIRLLQNSTNDSQIRSDITGTGSYTPMTFYTGGSERMRLDTSGNLGIGNTTPIQSERLHIKGATLGGTTGDTSYNTVFYTPDVTNATRLSVLDYRVSNGTSHTSSRNVIQRRVDGTDMGFVGFDSNFTSIGWGTTVAVAVDSSGNVGIGNPAANVNDQVGAVRPLLVSASDTVTTIAGSKANIVIGNADTTTNNTSQLTFAAITGANATYYAAAAINCVFGARTNGQYPTGQLVFSTSTSLNSAPTEKMRIDNSGNVGIGTASPGYKFDVVKGSVGDVARFTNGVDASLIVGAPTGGITYNQLNGGYQSWQIASSEKMRLDSSGNVGIGTASPDANHRLHVVNTGAKHGIFAQIDDTAYYCQQNWNSAGSGDNKFASFLTDVGATLRGSISYNRVGGLVAYNTTSDYRAKDVFGAWDDSGATIDALKVYRGKMHGATQERPMMIAHEAQAVVPYAVSGEKDAVDKDGKPVYQQMDHQILVPLLIAELQAVRARLAALEAK